MVPNYLATPLAWIDGTVGSVHVLPGATNVNALKQGLLYPYNPNVGVYQCPTALTTQPKTITTKGVRLVRNYSLEGRMGGAGPVEPRDTAFPTPRGCSARLIRNTRR